MSPWFHHRTLLVSVVSVVSVVSAVACVATGCAQGSSSAVDAGVEPDAPISELDAAVDADPGPDACVPMTTNVLQNADFEAGASGWVETTNGPMGIIRQMGAGLPFDPNDGMWAAILGGFSNAQITFAQTVTVPSELALTRLAFAGCWVTDEGAGVFDTLTLELLDSQTDTVLMTLLAISNEDAAATCEWVPMEQSLATVTETELELRFTVTTDGATVTTFAFDSFAVEAISSCQ